MSDGKLGFELLIGRVTRVGVRFSRTINRLAAMPDQDKELAAINAVVTALADLDDEVRARVMDYVANRFRIVGRSTPVQTVSPAVLSPVNAGPDTPLVGAARPVDIKALKDEKRPSSSIQMAVLVAYYLKALAPESDRKEAISAADVETYFTQARYQLPTGKNGLVDTLNNARQAGYFESAGRGLFRLNSVGFNLAAYNMPTGSVKSAPKSKGKPKSRKR